MLANNLWNLKHGAVSWPASFPWFGFMDDHRMLSLSRPAEGKFLLQDRRMNEGLSCSQD
jgi:hypothetical protein